MKRSALPQRLVLAMALSIAVLLTACSKTVTWEEEVLLNTGEVIWVKRLVQYSLKGDAGNPLDMAYRPDWIETLSFAWKGKKYSYEGDADVMLLAISPLSGEPVLIANAALKNWDTKHDYRCTTPYYVQLVPKSNSNEWTWPLSIEPWLYEMQTNLLLHRAKFEEIKPRYAIDDRIRLDAGLSQFLKRIDSSFKFDSCKKKGN